LVLASSDSQRAVTRDAANNTTVSGENANPVVSAPYPARSA
jgi:hypothetical protein